MDRVEVAVGTRQCSLCGTWFTSDVQWRWHLRRHLGAGCATVCVCADCGMAFADEEQRDAHQAAHAASGRVGSA